MACTAAVALLLLALLRVNTLQRSKEAGHVGGLQGIDAPERRVNISAHLAHGNAVVATRQTREMEERLVMHGCEGGEVAARCVRWWEQVSQV